MTGTTAVTRPACPTSCCISSVAPRTPLCISVRFQIVFCAPVICISAVVTMLETTSSRPVANSNSINEKPEKAGQLRHVGFEDDAVEGYSSSLDVNGLEWELFSAAEQDRRIVSTYGVPVKS